MNLILINIGQTLNYILELTIILYILKNMYIIVKNLSKGSKKNTKKTYFI